MASSGGRPGVFRGGLRLLRVPNLLTVPGDPVAGGLLAADATGTEGLSRLAWAAGAATAFYAAGLLLNDWSDRAEDARDRPDRPLPSGIVRPGAALAAAVLLGLAGFVLAAVSGPASFGVAVVLAGLVLLYNLWAKDTGWGAWVMGGCRAASLGLGAAAMGWRPDAVAPVALAGLMLFLYVAALTRVARRETAAPEARPPAWPPVLVLAGGWLGTSVMRGMPMSPGALLWGAVALAWAAMAAHRWRRCGPAAIGGLIGALPFWQAFLVQSTGVAGAWRLSLLLAAAGLAAAGLRRTIPAS